MSDPWTEAAKNYKPQSGGTTAPAASSEDYKVWQQGNSSVDDATHATGFLDHLQKAVDLAASPEPLESGQPAWSQRVASGMVRGVLQPLVHPVKTAESMVDNAMHSPITNPVGAIMNPKAAMETLPGVGMAREAKQIGVAPALEREVGELGAQASLAGGLPEAAGGLRDIVPSRARAGATFDSLNTDLANHPVHLSATLKPLQRITEVGERASTIPAPVLKFIQRAQMSEPMTFPEARDYQGGLSDLSAADRAGMPSRVKGALSQLNKALYEDIKASADAAGRGDDYEAAMREYRQASRLRDIVKNTGKAAVGAGAGYAGAQGIKRFLEASSK